MKKSVEFQIKGLAKLMAYILCRRPDEFGLVLDEEGFVSLKELHSAIIEEEGWTHIRMTHIEVAARQGDAEHFDIREDRIRARKDTADSLLYARQPAEPPTALYFAARRKAYAHILQHGLEPGGKPFVPMAATEELALRMGSRRDSRPVLLTIQARMAHDEGFKFTKSNELIYLADSIPVRYISGPPLEQVAESLPERPKKEPQEARTFTTPEYDALRMAYRMEPGSRKKHKEEASWKESARKYRRERRKK